MPRTRTSFAKGNPHAFKPGSSGNPGGRPPLVENLHELAREHAPEVIARLLQLMRQDEDRDIALAAANSLLDRGYGRPSQAILAQVNAGLTLGGIDRPPEIVNETDEEWLARRRAELAELESPRREPPP